MRPMADGRWKQGMPGRDDGTHDEGIRMREKIADKGIKLMPRTTEIADATPPILLQNI